MNKYRSVINSSKPYNVDVLTSYLEDPFVWKDKEPASIKAEERRRRRGYSCVEKLRAFRIAKTHFSEHAFLTSDFFNIGSLTCKFFPLLKIVAFPFFVGRTTLLSLVFFWSTWANHLNIPSHSTLNLSTSLSDRLLSKKIMIPATVDSGYF